MVFTLGYNIPLTLDRDFQLQLMELAMKYGEEFEKLNGFHESQLNYSSFINGFVDRNNQISDVTIDANANASNHAKDVRSLLSEMNKAQLKLFSMNKLFYEMKKRYGLATAKEWFEYEYNGLFYMHDASTASIIPYCFRGDTEIMTNMGIRRLDTLVEQPIKVLNKNHGWEDAIVHYFGKAPIRILTLERHGVVKNIACTGNHLWFVRAKKLVPGGLALIKTDDLQPGMHIPFNASNIAWASLKPSPFGIAHGFYTGDGDKKNDRANFCGDKTALLPYFTPAIVSGNETEYTTSGMPNSFGQLPDITLETHRYLYGWLAGYFAADGCIDEHGICTISSTRIENLQRARDILCILGMPVNEIRYQDRISNLTGEMGRVYILTLSTEYLKEDFFIRPLHKARYESTKNKFRRHHDWTVQSVVDTGTIDDVYCATSLTTESFTLSNNILTHNCFAFDLGRLAREGLFFLTNYNYEAPKHFTTFLDDVIEFISYMSNRQSGAVGMSNLLVWSYWFYKNDCDTGYYIKDHRYYAKQCFQKFIYRANQHFLRISEPAFTNVSIFDRPYYESLFGGLEFPDGQFAIDMTEEFMEFQKLFMETVAEIRKSNQMTFPVLSYSLLFQNGKFVDEEMARWCCSHNIKWGDSNFFTSGDVGTLSNCCFDPLGQNEVVSTFENLYKTYHDKVIYVKGINGLAKRAKIIQTNARKMYKITLSTGDVLYCTDNHIHLTNTGDKKTSALTLHDKLKHASLDWVGIKEIKRYYASGPYVYCFEMEDQTSPYFTLPNGIITHNCRLLSDTKKLTAFINSTGGTALSIGSVKVNTINLMRIAYMSGKDEEAYLQKLKEAVELCCKILVVQRHTIQRNIKKGLLPNVCEGGIDMNKMYSTIGINACYEVMEYFGYINTDEFGNVSYSPEADRFADRILGTINQTKDAFPVDFSFNVEAVPAERAAVILCKKDNILYGQNDKFIYSNQWIPMAGKALMAEKIRVSSRLDKQVQGGQILHINIDAPFSSDEAAWDLLNYIASKGVIYFAFNLKIFIDKHNHGFVGTNICPQCGSPKTDEVTRIVGYLVPTKSFSSDRKREYDERYWYEVE